MFFFDKSVTIRRLRKNADGYRSAISATMTAYQASLQVANDEKTQMAGGEIGKVYSLYTDVACPMKEADEAVVDGVKYSVKGVGDAFNFGSLEHKRYIVVKEED